MRRLLIWFPLLWSALIVAITISMTNGRLVSAEKIPNTRPDWPPVLAHYDQRYLEFAGTNAAALPHQLQCLVQDSYDNRDTWGDNFPYFVWNFMAFDNPNLGGSDVACAAWLPDWVCFAIQGTVHLNYELRPGYAEYCNEVSTPADFDQWDFEHDSLLVPGIGTCFQGEVAAGELPAWFAPLVTVYVTVRAEMLRETIQSVCDEITGNTLAAQTLDPAYTSSRDTLYLDGMDERLGYRIIADNEQFMLGVGDSVQLHVQQLGEDGVWRSLATHGRLQLLVGQQNARLTRSGRLLVERTDEPLAALAAPIFIVSRVGDSVALGQFAIAADDVNQDHIADSVLPPQAAGTVTIRDLLR